ncbi:MAG: sugar ABC transporter permease, partial [Niameybacter sp.]
IWHVNIPGILPTVTILLIMNFGSVMSVGYEKILLMQNSLNMPKSDVISTFVYRMGLESAQYSFSAAVGLFNAVINFILLVIVNKVAKKLGETSLW